LLFSSTVHSIICSNNSLAIYILFILTRLFPWIYMNYLFFSLAFLHLSVNWCFSMISIHFSHIFSLLLCGSDLSKAFVAKLKSPIIIRLLYLSSLSIYSFILSIVFVFSFFVFGMYMFSIVNSWLFFLICIVTTLP